MKLNALTLRIRIGPGTCYKAVKAAEEALQEFVLAAELPAPVVAACKDGRAALASWWFTCDLDGNLRSDISDPLLELTSGIGADIWFGPSVQVAHPALLDPYTFWQKLNQAVEWKRDDDAQFAAFVEPLAQLALRLCSVAEAAQQAGASPEQLTDALKHAPTAQAVDALVLRMNEDGTTCLRRAIARLETVVEDPASRVADIVAATKALIRLRPQTSTRAGRKFNTVRHIASAREVATETPPETIVSYRFDTTPTLPAIEREGLNR